MTNDETVNVLALLLWDLGVLPRNARDDWDNADQAEWRDAARQVLDALESWQATDEQQWLPIFTDKEFAAAAATQPVTMEHLRLPVAYALRHTDEQAAPGPQVVRCSTCLQVWEDHGENCTCCACTCAAETWTAYTEEPS